jgi:hypothetical protein
VRGGAFDAALQPANFGRQFAVGRAFEERVDAALELDRADRIGREPQPDRPDGVGQERDRLQIRQEPPLGLAVRVADIIADLDTLAGHRASARHAAPFSDTHKIHPPRGSAVSTARARRGQGRCARPAPLWLLKQRIYSQSGPNPLIFNKSLPHKPHKGHKPLILLDITKRRRHMAHHRTNQVRNQVDSVVPQFECWLRVKAESPDPPVYHFALIAVVHGQSINS